MSKVSEADLIPYEEETTVKKLGSSKGEDVLWELEKNETTGRIGPQCMVEL